MVGSLVVSWMLRQERKPGRSMSYLAATCASSASPVSLFSSPARTATTLPQNWVWPSYTHNKLSPIGTLKLGVERSAGRRYLPFHEWLNSWVSRSCGVVRFQAVKKVGSTPSSLERWCSSPLPLSLSDSENRKS